MSVRRISQGRAAQRPARSRFVVGAVGRLEPIKNHALLVEAAEFARRHRAHGYLGFVLTLVGVIINVGAAWALAFGRFVLAVF